MKRHPTPRIARKLRRPAAVIAATVTALAAVSAAIAAFAEDGSTGRQDFALSASPHARTVYLGKATSYAVAVSRLNGFKGAVRLSVSGIPAATTARWRLSDGTRSNVVPPKLRRAWLVLQTSWRTRTGSRTLTITGTGRRPNGTRIRHSVTVTLAVRPLFVVRGNLRSRLYPGVSRPLSLALTNPNSFDVRVTRVGVHVARTSRAGCATSNFAVAQMPLSVYPLTLRAGTSRTLNGLHVPSAKWPRVKMIDASWRQDACKDAHVTLLYSGRGRR